MAGSGRTYRLYGTTSRIVLSAAVAVVFGVRAAMSAAGTSSLAGPAWTAVDVLIAVAALIRCFDRIVVTARGITTVRVGIPRRTPADRIHQLVRSDANGSWSRLYAESGDGSRKLITMERRNAAGMLRMDELCDQAKAAFAARSAIEPGPALPVAAIRKASVHEPRRCVRGGCSAYLAEVSSVECAACGGRTQRAPG